MYRTALGALLVLGLAGPAFAQAPVSKRLSSDSCPGSGCLTIPTANMGAVALQIVGTMDGTISFKGSIDCRNFAALTLSKLDGTSTASSATAAGQWFGNIGGLRCVQAVFTTYTSGTPMVTLSASTSGGGGGSATVGEVTVGDVTNAGTFAVQVSSALPAGTNNVGDVDVASIAAGDNNIGNVDIASALPTGTNAIGKLAANSGVDIGDVDVTSLPPIPAGTSVIGKVRSVTATGDETTDDTADAQKILVVDEAGDPVDPGILDPCKGNVKGFYTTSFTAASASLVTGTASKKTYICSIVATLPTEATETFSIVGGTGTVCATSTAAVMGGATAANGFAMGFSHGNGDSAIAATDTNQDDLCALKSSTTDRLVLVITYAVQ